MKSLLTIILMSLCSFSILAQDSTSTEEIEKKLEILAEVTQTLISQIDSLNEKIEQLELDAERTKWVQIREGATMDEVILIMGDPDEYVEADFGYKKMIYGEGYSGYVLLDKEKKVVDSTPPLYLRLESELINK